jgi:hypothetical protein
MNPPSSVGPVKAYTGPSGDSDLRTTYATSSLAATGAVLFGAAE